MLGCKCTCPTEMRTEREDTLKTQRKTRCSCMLHSSQNTTRLRSQLTTLKNVRSRQTKQPTDDAQMCPGASAAASTSSPLLWQTWWSTHQTKQQGEERSENAVALWRTRQLLPPHACLSFGTLCVSSPHRCPCLSKTFGSRVFPLRRPVDAN